MTRFINCSLAGLMLFALALPASATDIFCTVVGSVQGTFQGDPTTGGNATKIAVYSLTQEIKVPLDPSSGQATGRAQHKPVVIVKELDKSSPLFFTAAVTGEVLKSVTCTLYKSSGGQDRPYFKIALTNATVVEIKDTGNGVNGDAPSDERELISFAYQKIEVTDLNSSITAADDWNIAN